MAKNYVYWNLHKGLWSVRRRGRVVRRERWLEAWNAEFRVNYGGWERVRREMKKNVHAFVVSSVVAGPNFMDCPRVDDYIQVRYCPYDDLIPGEDGPYFTVAKTGDKVVSARHVVMLPDRTVWADCINYRIGD